MKFDLEPAKAVLRAFLADIEELKNIRQSISAPQMATAFSVVDRTPIFDSTEFTPAPESCWQNEDAYIWLHADAWDFSSFMHRPKANKVPEYYQQPALPLYQQWHQEKKELFHRKCKKIPAPVGEMTLINYLQQLALTVSEKNEHRDVWIESLCSFRQFLREDTEMEQRGPLESLFPSKDSCKGMELRKGYSFERRGKKIKKVERRYILRRTEDTVYPIDILATSEIVINLAKIVLWGRPNSQRSAAEALGFAWLCLAVSSYPLTTREDIVFSTEVGSLKSSDSKEFCKPTHFIGVNSLFGIIDVPISKTLYGFLLALPREPEESHVFTMPWETLLRTFRGKGVKLSKRARGLGQITFLTFMSHPHAAIGYRPFLAQKFSKPKKLSPTKQSE